MVLCELTTKLCFTAELHTVTVLKEAAATGTDIDGDVLVYLEMAQVKLHVKTLTNSVSTKCSIYKCIGYLRVFKFAFPLLINPPVMHFEPVLSLAVKITGILDLLSILKKKLHEKQ